MTRRCPGSLCIPAGGPRHHFRMLSAPGTPKYRSFRRRSPTFKFDVLTPDLLA